MVPVGIRRWYRRVEPSVLCRPSSPPFWGAARAKSPSELGARSPCPFRPGFPSKQWPWLPRRLRTPPRVFKVYIPFAHRGVFTNDRDAKYQSLPRPIFHPFVVDSSLDFGDAKKRSELILDLCNKVLNPVQTTNIGQRAVPDSPMSSMEPKNTLFKSSMVQSAGLLQGSGCSGDSAQFR
jgi:hypothetical protein